MERISRQRASRSTDLAALSLLEFIPAATPTILGDPTQVPVWLAPYAERLERAQGSGVELCVAAPPQNGKTILTTHGMAWWMLRSSDIPFYYITYNQSRSDRVAADFWMLAERVGLKPLGRKTYWRSNSTGCRVMFTSIGGGITGEPLPANAVIVIDDPIKDRQEALSKARRESAWGWIFGSVMTRRHPGSSLVSMATRWAIDDPIGRLIDKFGFEYLRFPAICDDEETDPNGRKLGEILWDHHSLDEYRRLERVDPWGFAAMYQGRPTPRGAEVFQANPPRFRTLPDSHFKRAYGIDLAYTANTSADRSVCLRLHRYPSQRGGYDYYVVAGRHARVDAPSFLLTLVAMQAEAPAPMRWYIGGGGEKGAAQFVQRKVKNLRAQPATTDKLVRATPMSEAWNDDRIFLPDEESPYYGEWVDLLIDEHASFSGKNDPSDDFVDALAAGFDEANMTAPRRNINWTP
jgi:hypothetical protein